MTRIQLIPNKVICINEECFVVELFQLLKELDKVTVIIMNYIKQNFLPEASLEKTIKDSVLNQLNLFGRGKQPQPIHPPMPKDLLIGDILSIEEYKLFDYKQFSVFCADLDSIPYVIKEIGRLREVEFRKIGEGSGRCLDLDRFDLYYKHLFIWDNDKENVVGAYRIGKGNEIVVRHGIKGFYSNTLFSYKRALESILANALELGRSFISGEYQRQYYPLFLLWKGVFHMLIKNKEYRYLIGPVSISNDYSMSAKSLMVNYINTYCMDAVLADFIRARRKFRYTKSRAKQLEKYNIASIPSLKDLDSCILELTGDKKMPVLLKKYLNVNARIIGFNIDPKFNNCLDALMILDIFDIPDGIMDKLGEDI